MDFWWWCQEETIRLSHEYLNKLVVDLCSNWRHIDTVLILEGVFLFCRYEWHPCTTSPHPCSSALPSQPIFPKYVVNVESDAVHTYIYIHANIPKLSSKLESRQRHPLIDLHQDPRPSDIMYSKQDARFVCYVWRSCRFCRVQPRRSVLNTPVWNFEVDGTQAPGELPTKWSTAELHAQPVPLKELQTSRYREVNSDEPVELRDILLSGRQDAW